MDIIAEIGQAHDGKLELAHDYIDALSGTGVDAVKFQVHIADAESSIYEPFRIKFSKDKTRFDYWKRIEFSVDEWKDLKNHCDEAGVEFLASPFSNAAVDLLEEVGVKRYKIGSGEVNNFLMLDKIAKLRKPIILSSGMSSFEELDHTIAFLEGRGIDFSVLQCTTAYPTGPENFGLNVIADLKERYGVAVGYSDHSGKTETCIAAAALGAEILEFHAVFSRDSSGPDASSSLEMDEIKRLVPAVNNIRKALQHPIDKSDSSHYIDLKNIFEKSLSVNKDIKEGQVITFNDLEAKKPKGRGIDAALFEQVVGTISTRDLKQWEFLNLSDIRG